MTDDLDSRLRDGFHALADEAGAAPRLDDILTPAPGPTQRRTRGPWALAAAGIVLALATAGGLAALRNHPADTTDVATGRGAGTEVPAQKDNSVDAALVKKLQERQAAAVKNCSQDKLPAPPTTAENKTDQVLVGGGANCEYGRVDAALLNSREAEVRPLPVYPPGDGTTVIGYWAAGVGWLTVEDVKDPDFDLGAYQRAGAVVLGVSSGSSQSAPG